MRRRRTFLESLGVAATTAVAGCSQDGSGSSSTTGTAGGDTTATEVVAAYYDAVASGDLERAAEYLALTALEQEGGSPSQVAEILRQNGMSNGGNKGTVGSFEELSVTEFTEFSFQTEESSSVEMTEQRANEVLNVGTDIGADRDDVRIVHRTDGFAPGLWVPYQPTPSEFETDYPDGWGEVVLQVGTYDGDLLIIGDFRSYTDYKVIA